MISKKIESTEYFSKYAEKENPFHQILYLQKLRHRVNLLPLVDEKSKFTMLNSRVISRIKNFVLFYI